MLNPFLVEGPQGPRGLWDQDMMDNLKYFDGELKDTSSRVPADLKQKPYLTAFDIDHKWVVDAAARHARKWIRPVPVREPLRDQRRRT